MSEDGERPDPRTAIVVIAARLLREHGAAGVTTRKVAEAAGVQPPAIYRLFGHKDGLLDAVAEHVMTDFVESKAADVRAAATTNADPVDDLHRSWHRQIEFGVANPALFRLLSDPDRVRGSAAARAGRDVLAARVRRVAATGRLRVSEQRAVDLIHAAGVGSIQALLEMPEADRDLTLADAMFGAVRAQILDDAEPVAHRPVLQAAVAFRAVAAHLDALTAAERHLVLEWLDRVIADGER